jgi:hypothetical protein
MQSKEYQKMHIVRCLSVLRTLREKVMQSMGVCTDGSSHTEVNAMGDVQRIAQLLIKDLAMVQCVGRYQCGPRGSPVDVQEAVDGFDRGIDEIMKGETLRTVLDKRRTTHSMQETEYDVPEAAYQDFEGYLQHHSANPTAGWINEEELSERMQGLKVMREKKSVENSQDDLRNRNWCMR